MLLVGWLRFGEIFQNRSKFGNIWKSRKTEKFLGSKIYRNCRKKLARRIEIGKTMKSNQKLSSSIKPMLK